MSIRKSGWWWQGVVVAALTTTLAASCANGNGSAGGGTGSNASPSVAAGAPAASAAAAGTKAAAPRRNGALTNVTAEMRKAAADHAATMGLDRQQLHSRSAGAPIGPSDTPDYFGPYPNYANSPLPTVDATTGAVSGGIRKFVDTLPGLGASNANNLGNFLPVAIPDTTSYPGSDYYEIGLVEYSQKLHTDLPATKLRGYKQLNTTDPGASAPHYLGPMIVAQKDRPVRVKFINQLGTGTAGNLFLPVDTTVMGAGMGPLGMAATPMNYTENRATLHLHGGNTPWISDGTQHQWTTPLGENTSYPQGVSVRYVPDMDNGSEPQGTLTFYYTNQQSARLLFYHDHAYGITRLNVYAGEAAPYLLRDTTEQALITAGVLPADEIPLVVQDKTFVPDATQLAAEDPTWNTAKWGGKGNLWYPHVYMPNQNPFDITGAAPMGRWDYGPWFWPPFTGIVFGPTANPYYDPVNAPWEPPVIPATPNPTIVPEGFMDTPVINGAAYPVLHVKPKAYRFRILNAANDRYWNLQLYYAKSNATMWNADGTLANADAGEVNMVPAIPNAGLPPTWPTDGRDGNVPDPGAVGPTWLQIGTEAGVLPAVAERPPTPVGYDYDRRSVTVLNVTNTSLFLGPAERADVVVDFTNVPPGSKLILYNDSPAPVPAFDTRYDYYTGDPDQTAMGGAPSTLPGYGPNTRTLMQIQVDAFAATETPPPAFSPDALKAAIPAAYAASQKTPIVPQADYNAAFNSTYPVDGYARIYSTDMTFFNGPLRGLQLTNPGAGYTVAPTVAFDGGGGTGAAAIATLATRPVATLTLTNNGSNYSTAPTVKLSGGGGSGATAMAVLALKSVASIAVNSGGNGYTSAPTVTLIGGGGSGATAAATITNKRVSAITVTNPGSGYSSVPTVTFTGGGGSGAAATATLTRVPVASLVLTNPGTGYTLPPSVSFSGGSGSGATAQATLAATSVASITMTNPGTGYTSAPTVRFAGDGAGAAAIAVGLTMDLQPKSIIEDFDPNYGRMNAMLGVEVPKTSATIQTSIPYMDYDPPTEIFLAGDAAAPIGTGPDGTQIWKITHNGVDTHAVHFHMFDVQLINRIGWDGMVKPPENNELGWKDTVRMNPLEDVVVAMRPIAPVLPWDLPNSVRPLDPTMPIGSTTGFLGVDPTNEPAPVTNQLVNYGWEYVWHCHLLGHEENTMMRSMALAVAPRAPASLAATPGAKKITLTWSDASMNETGFTVQRATSTSGPWSTVTDLVPAVNGTGTPVSYVDTTVARRTAYYYRIIANNVVGYTEAYAAPAVGYPHVTADSQPSNVYGPVTAQ